MYVLSVSRKNEIDRNVVRKNMFDNVKFVLQVARVVWAPLSLQTNWQFHLLTHISKALILARWLPCFAVLLALSSMLPARRSKHAAGLTHFPFIHLSTLKENWQMIIAKITCPPKLRNVMQKAAHFQMIWPEIGFFSIF